MLTVGNLARRVGIRNSAVRYYEVRGLLKPAARLPNGYRIYGEDAVGLLTFVRRAQTLGITLKEVRNLLELSRRGQSPCAEVKDLARRHLSDLDRKIRGLELLRGELQLLLRRKVRRPQGNTLCPLIEGA
ncbi:MAG TPA: MerR family DNA-binding protein [Candidatus Eisenbacteria bacterium]|nr:MerR family DNA-binding protein [Candidatus Eisenbacteria bacterium]